MPYTLFLHSHARLNKYIIEEYIIGLDGSLVTQNPTF